MTTLDVLREALGRIERDGWCQGYSVGKDGSVCALYAIEGAAGCVTDDDFAFRRPPTPARALANDAASAVLQAAGVTVPKQLVDWNDAEGRTVEEVIAAFRGAIARLEGTA